MEKSTVNLPISKVSECTILVDLFAFILGSTPIAVNQRTAELKFPLYVHSMFFKVVSFIMSGTLPMNIWLYQTLSS